MLRPPSRPQPTWGLLVAAALGLELLTTAGLDEAIVHLDEFLPAMFMDHPRADMRAKFPRRLRALAARPQLALQIHTQFSGSDTLDSPVVP